jgi:hypothetical protein
VTILTSCGAFVAQGSPDRIFTAAANAREIVCNAGDLPDGTGLGDRYDGEFVLRPLPTQVIGIAYSESVEGA